MLNRLSSGLAACLFVLGMSAVPALAQDCGGGTVYFGAIQIHHDFSFTALDYTCGYDYEDPNLDGDIFEWEIFVNEGCDGSCVGSVGAPSGRAAKPPAGAVRADRLPYSAASPRLKEMIYSALEAAAERANPLPLLRWR